MSPEEAFIRERAAEIFQERYIDQWMPLPNETLDGRSPVECIEGGDTRAVLGVLAAIADGAYF